VLKSSFDDLSAGTQVTPNARCLLV